MKLIHKSQGVQLLREGDSFHVVSTLRNESGQSFESHRYITKNKQEAAVNYADAVSARLVQGILNKINEEGD